MAIFHCYVSSPEGSRTTWFQPVLSRAERASPQSFLVCLSEPFPRLRLHLGFARGHIHFTNWGPPHSDFYPLLVTVKHPSIIHWHPHFPSFFLAYSHSTSPFWPVKCHFSHLFPLKNPPRWGRSLLGPVPVVPVLLHGQGGLSRLHGMGGLGSLMVSGWVLDGFWMGISPRIVVVQWWYHEKCVEKWLKNEWNMNEQWMKHEWTMSEQWMSTLVYPQR